MLLMDYFKEAATTKDAQMEQYICYPLALHEYLNVIIMINWCSNSIGKKVCNITIIVKRQLHTHTWYLGCQ